MTQIDPGAVIGKAFTIYRENAAVLLPIALGALAVQAIVLVLLAGNVVGAVVSLILATIISTLLTGIFVEVARDVEDGVLDSSPGQLVSAVFPAVVPLIVVGILAGLAVGLGIVLLIAPGLFLATIFAVVAPVTVLERPGVLAAFGRSRQLVAGNGWQVFGLVLFNIVLNLLSNQIAAGLGGGVAGGAVSWIVASLVAPLSALIVATAYLQLRQAHGEAPLPSGIATADGPLHQGAQDPNKPGLGGL